MVSFREELLMGYVGSNKESLVKIETAFRLINKFKPPQYPRDVFDSISKSED